MNLYFETLLEILVSALLFLNCLSRTLMCILTTVTSEDINRTTISPII